MCLYGHCFFTIVAMSFVALLIGSISAQSTRTRNDRPDHNKFYPEIAVPLELVSGFDINGGQNQSIWVDSDIPGHVPAGLYLGTVRIGEDGSTSHEVPVELLVRNFVLPDEANGKTMLGLGYEDIKARYPGEEYPEAGSDNEAALRLIRDRHFQLAHRHRITLIDGNERSIARENREPRNRLHSRWLPRLNDSLFAAAGGYDGPDQSQVVLHILNLFCEEIVRLVDEGKDAASYSIAWNGKAANRWRLPGCVYFFQFIAKDFVKTRKMVLQR